jgi:hypothetical protein
MRQAAPDRIGERFYMGTQKGKELLRDNWHRKGSQFHLARSSRKISTKSEKVKQSYNDMDGNA